jgi:putative hemolysin
MAKPLGWILQYIHPQLKHVSRAMPETSHTGLYEKSDVIELLSVQQKQSDNRINEFEIDLLKHVLNFGDKKVSDVMTPRRRVKAISVSETLGPIVLSELHKTKHIYFPVYGAKTTDIVGILSITALTNSRLTLKVSEIMSQSLHYVHEDQYLNEALQVIIKSSQEVLIVINSDQEYVGIITAREILKNLVGDVITEEFDNYDNRELVANWFTLPGPPTETAPPLDEPDISNQETSA